MGRVFQMRPVARFVLSVLFLMAGSAQAQEATPVAWPHAASKTQHIHAEGSVCGSLFVMDNVPGARQGLENYHAAKAAGQLPAAHKTQQTYQIGQVVTFNVLVNIRDLQTRAWEAKEFTLMAEGDAFFLWVDNFELQDQGVTDDDVERLRKALGDETPDGSFNPDQGIIENDNAIFGDPPDYDTDGKVDVLLYDITEGIDDGIFVLGYVIATDISPNAPAGEGNQRDVLYLDTAPGLGFSGSNDIGATAAHEYQHLIHYNYDRTESSFVNEGLSEWAQSINGYPARSADYLLDPGSLYNTSLFGWRNDGSSNFLIDYSRASIFTNYFAEQVGLETAGSLTRIPLSDFFGYQALFNQNPDLGLDIEDLIANFHTANALNDTSVDPRYGYITPQRKQEVRVRPRRTVDGSAVTKTPPTDILLQPGGAEYVVWQNVADFRVVIDIQGGNNTTRPFIRPKLILESTDGSIEVQDLTPSPLENNFDGVFNKITLVVPHVRAAATPVRFEYSADWAGTSRQFISRQYDDGEHRDSTAFIIGSEHFGAQASRFQVPEGAAISKVQLANFYLSQFDVTGIPDTAPRDFTLTVWADDGTGLPGEELFTRTFQDPRDISPPLITYNHFELDIERFANHYFPLPDIIYVGFQEAGTDRNFMVVAPSRYNGENTSFVRDVNDGTTNTFWVPLSNLLVNNISLENTTLPIRVEFVIDPTITEIEDGLDLPESLTLAPNYPNPFNPGTAIQYTVPEAMPVRVAVYDVTGRQMTLLADGLQPAGTHTVTLNAEAWASGVYFYTLEAGASRLTRKMLLLK